MLAALGDAALARELEPRLARAPAPGSRGALDARRRASSATARGARPAGSRSRAGATRSAPVAAAPRGRRASCARTAATRPPPLADADCQAAAVAALDALARLDPGGGWDARAAALRARVAEAFAPGADWALAIEADGTPVPGAGSQLGWLLWAGALEPDAAAPRPPSGSRAPDVLTAYGLRTLSAGASRVPARQPTTAAASGRSTAGSAGAGCAPPGRVAEAERVRAGVLAALDRLGRAPELYAVDARGRARAGPGRQPRPGLDGRRALGVRARLGRPRAMTNSHGRDSVLG